MPFFHEHVRALFLNKLVVAQKFGSAFQRYNRNDIDDSWQDKSVVELKALANEELKTFVTIIVAHTLITE